MSPIEEQKAIISKLANLLHNSVADEYDEVSCDFRYQVASDGSYSVIEKASCGMSGEQQSIYLAENSSARPLKLIPELHRLMVAHTGGGWTEFTLTLDKEGKATTKFRYPE